MEEPEFKRCPECNCLMSFNQEVCGGCGWGKAKAKKRPAAKAKSSRKKA